MIRSRSKTLPEGFFARVLLANLLLVLVLATRRDDLYLEDNFWSFLDIGLSIARNFVAWPVADERFE